MAISNFPSGYTTESPYYYHVMYTTNNTTVAWEYKPIYSLGATTPIGFIPVQVQITSNNDISSWAIMSIPEDGEIEVVDVTEEVEVEQIELSDLIVNKGDIVRLLASGRVFEVIDERRDNEGNSEELCKFDDDPRNPIWILHKYLSDNASAVKLTYEEKLNRSQKKE